MTRSDGELGPRRDVFFGGGWRSRRGYDDDGFSACSKLVDGPTGSSLGAWTRFIQGGGRRLMVCLGGMGTRTIGVSSDGLFFHGRSYKTRVPLRAMIRFFETSWTGSICPMPWTISDAVNAMWDLRLLSKVRAEPQYDLTKDGAMPHLASLRRVEEQIFRWLCEIWRTIECCASVRLTVGLDDSPRDAPSRFTAERA